MDAPQTFYGAAKGRGSGNAAAAAKFAPGRNPYNTRVDGSPYYNVPPSNLQGAMTPLPANLQTFQLPKAASNLGTLHAMAALPPIRHLQVNNLASLRVNNIANLNGVGALGQMNGHGAAVGVASVNGKSATAPPTPQNQLQPTFAPTFAAPTRQLAPLPQQQQQQHGALQAGLRQNVVINAAPAIQTQQQPPPSAQAIAPQIGPSNPVDVSAQQKRIMMMNAHQMAAQEARISPKENEDIGATQANVALPDDDDDDEVGGVLNDEEQGDREGSSKGKMKDDESSDSENEDNQLDDDSSNAQQHFGGKKGKFNPMITDYLISWFLRHTDHPYPEAAELTVMSRVTSLNPEQVNRWFTNIRKRHWTPVVKRHQNPKNYLQFMIKHGYAPPPNKGIKINGRMDEMIRSNVDAQWAASSLNYTDLEILKHGNLDSDPLYDSEGKRRHTWVRRLEEAQLNTVGGGQERSMREIHLEMLKSAASEEEGPTAEPESFRSGAKRARQEMNADTAASPEKRAPLSLDPALGSDEARSTARDVAADEALGSPADGAPSQKKTKLGHSSEEREDQPTEDAQVETNEDTANSISISPLISPTSTGDSWPSKAASRDPSPENDAGTSGSKGMKGGQAEVPTRHPRIAKPSPEAIQELRLSMPSTSYHMGHSRRFLPRSAVEYLKNWFCSPEHINHPYPSEAEKEKIAADTGLSTNQVDRWLMNNRKRVWRPWVAKQASLARQNDDASSKPEGGVKRIAPKGQLSASPEGAKGQSTSPTAHQRASASAAVGTPVTSQTASGAAGELPNNGAIPSSSSPTGGLTMSNRFIMAPLAGIGVPSSPQSSLRRGSNRASTDMGQGFSFNPSFGGIYANSPRSGSTGDLQVLPAAAQYQYMYNAVQGGMSPTMSSQPPLTGTKNQELLSPYVSEGQKLTEEETPAQAFSLEEGQGHNQSAILPARGKDEALSGNATLGVEDGDSSAEEGDDSSNAKGRSSVKQKGKPKAARATSSASKQKPRSKGSQKAQPRQTKAKTKGKKGKGKKGGRRGDENLEDIAASVLLGFGNM